MFQLGRRYRLRNEERERVTRDAVIRFRTEWAEDLRRFAREWGVPLGNIRVFDLAAIADAMDPEKPLNLQALFELEDMERRERAE